MHRIATALDFPLTIVGDAPMLGITRKAAGWLRVHPRMGRLALMALPDIRISVRIPPIGSIAIRLRQHRSYWLRPPLTHEGFMLGALRRLIRPGDVVYDVGANIGLYARFIAHFGARQVIAFEPMTENRKLLALNVVGLPVEIMPLALADQDGEEDFQVDDLTSGSAALDRVTGGLASAGRRQYGLPPLIERVGVVRLDGLHHLPPPNVIKIDIEGAEAMMLRGAIRTLQQYGPRLAIEMHQVPITIEVIDFLIDSGYVTYGVLGTYRRIGREDSYLLTDPYSLHHIVASTDEADLRDPITAYA